MNILETVKMRRLLSKRDRLKSELKVLENVEYNAYETFVKPSTVPPEHYMQIKRVRAQIQSVNEQIKQIILKG